MDVRSSISYLKKINKILVDWKKNIEILFTQEDFVAVNIDKGCRIDCYANY